MLWCKLTVSRYDPHLFEWGESDGSRGLCEYLRKVIFSIFPFILSFTSCSAEEGSTKVHFWKERCVEDEPL